MLVFPVTLTPYSGVVSCNAIEFIENYEEIAILQDLSDPDKCLFLGKYLSHNAKLWYGLYYNSTVVWQDFKNAFLAYHLPYNWKQILENKFLKRVHYPDEDIRLYFIEKLNISRKIDTLSKKEIIDSLFEGILQKCKKLTYINAAPFKEINEFCKIAIRVFG